MSIQEDKLPHDDATAWWQLTGDFLQKLLSNADFSSEQQSTSVDFYREHVVSSLGAAPAANSPDLCRWRSFMTDDHTPIEFSWTWGSSSSIPDRRIRFSIEPISFDSGTPVDPWNQIATRRLLDDLNVRFHNLNLGWFDLLSGDITFNESLGVALTKMDCASPTSLFLAFELGESEPLVKTYMVPPARSSSQSIIINALKVFGTKVSCGALARLISFLETEALTTQLTPYMIATDCTEPEISRLKVYVRSPDTSFDSVRSTMSIFEDKSRISNGLHELEDVWRRLFCLADNFDSTTQLPSSSHETCGVLYYFEVRPGSSRVTTKVYIPVKHYGKDDWNTALALTDFFKAQDRIQARITDSYLTALKEVCTHRSLSSGRGMHTYISAAIKNNSLDLTSYLNPEVYHPARYPPAP